MAFFVRTMVNGPRYDPARDRREQAGWDEHAALMDELTEAGFVLLGGRGVTADPGGRAARG